MIEKTSNGGLQARIGSRFKAAIDEIIDKRLQNGKSKDRVSIEKITHMIVRHKLWKDISQDIIIATEEDINRYGK